MYNGQLEGKANMMVDTTLVRNWKRSFMNLMKTEGNFNEREFCKHLRMFYFLLNLLNIVSKQIKTSE